MLNKVYINGSLLSLEIPRIGKHLSVILYLQVITTPTENNKMYSQQRDEYLEQVCDMALRKISIITIFGPLANGTMKIDHYQMGEFSFWPFAYFAICTQDICSIQASFVCCVFVLGLTEQDKPVRSLPVSELINQELITVFRKELGMVYNDFFMVLTDFDMKVKVCFLYHKSAIWEGKRGSFYSASDFNHIFACFASVSQQQYEVPIIMKAVFDYIDTFSSRLKEMELQRKLGIACKKEDKSRSLENFLSRFPVFFW